MAGSECGETESWIHSTHHFFHKVFFPAYDHVLQLRNKIEQERFTEAARIQTALAKAKEAARYS